MGINEFAVLATMLARNVPLRVTDVTPALTLITQSKGNEIVLAQVAITRLMARGHVVRQGSRKDPGTNSRPQWLHVITPSGEQFAREYRERLGALLAATEPASKE